MELWKINKVVELTTDRKELYELLRNAPEGERNKMVGRLSKAEIWEKRIYEIDEELHKL